MKKIIKPKWHFMPQEFVICTKLFAKEGEECTMVKAFINEGTGETRFYQSFMVERIGSDAILRDLNKI